MNAKIELKDHEHGQTLLTFTGEVRGEEFEEYEDYGEVEEAIEEEELNAETNEIQGPKKYPTKSPPKSPMKKAFSRYLLTRSNTRFLGER